MASQEGSTVRPGAPIGSNATRLTVRVRADYVPSVKMTVVRPLMTLAHEAMERRQLYNLRRRAEMMGGA